MQLNAAERPNEQTMTVKYDRGKSKCSPTIARTHANQHCSIIGGDRPGLLVFVCVCCSLKCNFL